jgi:hypothetical protein
VRLPVTRAEKRTAAVAGTAAGGALLCAVCCVAPFALPAAVLAVAGGALAWLADASAWITTIALSGVAGAWLWIAVQSRRSGSRPATSTLVVLTVATLALALALSWPIFEANLLRMLRS